jgi:hypothetical protein
MRWESQGVLQSLEMATDPFTFEVKRCLANGIGDSRNMLTYLARCSRASKMLMLDDDMILQPYQFFRILSHTEPVVGALYPKKELPIRWAGEFMPGQDNQVMKQMWHLGTGFIRVDMAVVDQLVATSPPEDHYEGEHGEPLVDLFREGTYEADWFSAGRVWRRKLAEDYAFSYLWRTRCGGQCFLDSHCQVGHEGPVDYLRLAMEFEKSVNQSPMRNDF